MSISSTLQALFADKKLSADEVDICFRDLLAGQGSDVQIAVLLALLRKRKETLVEILTMVKILREHQDVNEALPDNTVDIVGTGGDETNSFNVSTAASFVAAAAGVPVAKHGSRSATSLSGSADVLEAAGANISLSAQESKRVFEKTGFCFLFAPEHNPILKRVKKIRTDLGIPTIFNIVGPLLNPFRVKRQVIGVFDEAISLDVCMVAEALEQQHVMVVHGVDGSDEISACGPTEVHEYQNGYTERYYINPADFGFKLGSFKDIQIGSREESLSVITSVLQGKRTDTARTVVALNAGAAVYVSGMTATLAEGVQAANQAIQSGAAYQTFLSFVSATQQE